MGTGKDRVSDLSKGACTINHVRKCANEQKEVDVDRLDERRVILRLWCVGTVQEACDDRVTCECDVAGGGFDGYVLDGWCNHQRQSRGA